MFPNIKIVQLLLLGICANVVIGRVLSTIADGVPANEAMNISPDYYAGPTASNPAELFEQIDTDGDGKISFDEAATWFARLSNRTKQDVLADAEFRFLFDQADTNGDGFIQIGELDSSLAMAMGPVAVEEGGDGQVEKEDEGTE